MNNYEHILIIYWREKPKG